MNTTPSFLRVMAIVCAVSLIPLHAAWPEMTLQVGKPDAAAKQMVRPLHGICNFAPFVGGAQLLPAFRELGAPYSYFHDAAYENPGLDLLDVSRIFPLFHADPEDPANYRFAESDLYLKMVLEAGTKIIFRLGETIEIFSPKQRVRPPRDFQKWAVVCEHIVRHYNEGWADGFRWDIRDWAIWEEPNNPNLWAGEFSQYLELYAVTAMHLKRRFPGIHVGGPETTTLGGKYFAQFLDFVKERKLPLDFTAFTAYFRQPDDMLEGCRERRRMLDERGFDKIPLWINEWHLCPDWDDWSHPAGRILEHRRVGGVQGGVYTTAGLCALQDAPVERACFYTSCMHAGWGLFDENGQPSPSFDVMLHFARLYRRSAQRLPIAYAGETANTHALASLRQDGGLDLMLGAFVEGMRTFRVGIPAGYSLTSLRVLDATGRRMEKCLPGEYRREGDTLVIEKPCGPAAYFAEFDRNP